MTYQIGIKKKIILSHIIVWCLAINFGFTPILNNIFQSKFRIIFLYIASICSILSIINNGIPKIKVVVPWLIFCGMISLNCLYFNRSLSVSRDLLLYILCILALYRYDNWIENIIRIIFFVCLIHVLATIIFFIFPSLYNATMPNLWGYYPIGTEYGLKGYCAAISPHYSTNGIYCATTFIISASLFFIGEKQGKSNRKNVFYMIISFIAVILTTKRAHLLFSVMAIFISYFICKKEQNIKKVLKLLLACVILICLFFIAMNIFPILMETVNRFLNSDDISTGRFDMWKLAWGLFLNNPLFGIGWNKYITVMANPLGIHPNYATSVHNVYLQVLCETGIVGFSTITFIMFYSYYNTIKLIRTNSLNNRLYNGLVVSAVIQTFVLLYNFTGNCLYDFTLYLYMIAILLLVTVKFNIKIKSSIM